jgi:type IV secretory pathway TrbL component
MTSIIIKRLALFILLLSTLGFAQDPTCETKEDDIYKMMFGNVSLWKPSGFSSSAITDPCDHTKIIPTTNYTSAIVAAVGKFGIALFLSMFLFEAFRRLLSGNGLHFTNSVRLYVSSAPVAVILGLAVTGGYETLITTIVITPIEAVVNSVMSIGSADLLNKFSLAYDKYAEANGEASSLLSFMAITSLSIPVILANAFILISLVIIWVMSLYISVMCTVVMCLGPLFLPFLVFQPLSQIGWNWVRTMIAYPMMCIVGAVVTSLLMGANMLNFTVETGQSASYLVSIATSIMFILVIIMVPSITNGFMQGVQSSPMSAGRALSRSVGNLFGGAASGAVLAGGGATYTAGKAAQVTTTTAVKGASVASWVSGGMEGGLGGFKEAFTASAERYRAHQIGGKIAGTGAAAFGHEAQRVVPGLSALVGGAKAAQRGWEKDRASDWSGNKASWEKTHADWGGKPGNWEEAAKKQSPKSQHAEIMGFAYQAYGKETTEQMEKATGANYNSFGDIPAGMHKYDFMKARVDEILAKNGIVPEKSYLNSTPFEFSAAIKNDPFLSNNDKEYLQATNAKLVSAGVSPEDLAFALRAEAVHRSGNPLAMMTYPAYMQLSRESKQEYLQTIAKKYDREYDTTKLPTNFLPRPIAGRTYEESILTSMDRRLSKPKKPQKEHPDFSMPAGDDPKMTQQPGGSSKSERDQGSAPDFSRMSYNRFLEMNQDSRRAYIAYVSNKHGLGFDLSKLPDEFIPYQGNNRTYEQGVLKALNHYFNHSERNK